jgi:hypothetical protein
MFISVLKWAYYLKMAKKAEKNTCPATQLGKPISPRQRRVQVLLQLIWANEALKDMRKKGVTSGAAWTEAIQLRECAIFARKALASLWP